MIYSVPTDLESDDDSLDDFDDVRNPNYNMMPVEVLLQLSKFVMKIFSNPDRYCKCIRAQKYTKMAPI